MKIRDLEIKPLNESWVEAMRKDAINFANYKYHYTPGCYTYWDILKLIATIDELREKIPAQPEPLPQPKYRVGQFVMELKSSEVLYDTRVDAGNISMIEKIQWAAVSPNYVSRDGYKGGFYEYKIDSSRWLAGSWLRALRPEEI